jgi:uncharacterized membrane protein
VNSEGWLHDVGEPLVDVVEAAGGAVILIGATLAVVRFVHALLRDRSGAGFVAIRLDLGRFLALGLELQLAGDLLRTALAPTFEQIGRVAAVAALRTVLNLVLDHEIRRERTELGGEGEERRDDR